MGIESSSPVENEAIINDQAWITLATNDSYALGALVLAHSLKRVKTQRKVVVMITSGITSHMKHQLATVFDDVIDVTLLDSGDIANLSLLERPELGITYTKLHCWKLVQFSKCVFLDADTLVLKHCDELFDRDELSAAPDAGWPDCFNSGVFVFKPSTDTFKDIMRHAFDHGSFDGGDQGLLNTFFADWPTADIAKHLPFLYNMCATATYTYIPAYKYYGHKVKIIHFIGATKPWHVQFDSLGEPQSGPFELHTIEHLRLWWDIFNTNVKPVVDEMSAESLPLENRDPSPSQDPGSPSQPQADGAAWSPPTPTSDNRGDWERGCPDFRGGASFDNILKKIDTAVSKKDDEKQ